MALAVAVAFGCRGGARAPDAEAAAAQADADVRVALPELVLPARPAPAGPAQVESVAGPGGFPMPAAARLEVADGGDVTYSVEATLETIMAFYAGQDGVKVTRNPAGATVVSERTAQYMLQLLPGKNRRLELLFVSLIPSEAPPAQQAGTVQQAGTKTVTVPVTPHDDPALRALIRQKLESGDGRIGPLLPKDLEQ